MSTQLRFLAKQHEHNLGSNCICWYFCSPSLSQPVLHVYPNDDCAAHVLLSKNTHLVLTFRGKPELEITKVLLKQGDGISHNTRMKGCVMKPQVCSQKAENKSPHLKTPLPIIFKWHPRTHFLVKSSATLRSQNHKSDVGCWAIKEQASKKQQNFMESLWRPSKRVVLVIQWHYGCMLWCVMVPT